jgi:uncharacterized membrane protein YdbT with pleckstrin-like domain
LGTYIQKNLVGDEKIIYSGAVSLWSMTHLFIIGLLFMPLFGFGLIFWLSAYINYKTTELAFTNKRVIAKFGFIRRSTVEMNIKKVESVQVDQGILGRIFNYGSIVISGAGNPQAPIPGISSPMEFRKKFTEYTDSNH